MLTNEQKLDFHKIIFTEFSQFFKNRNDPRQSLMCFGCECGKGWYELIYDFLNELNKYCIDNKIDFPQIVQIKEKFALIRIYVEPTTEEIFDIISKYEKISSETCEECGEKGEVREDLGYIRTLCDKHYLNYNKDRLKKYKEKHK
jgi:hypothetical protein